MASSFDQGVDEFTAVIRSVLTGAWIRRVAGIRDLGEVARVVLGWENDAAHLDVDANRSDIWARVRDVMSGRQDTARLFSPFNALWRRPPSGEEAVWLRNSNVDGPGTGLTLHGDGAPDAVPESLTETNTVLSPPAGTLRLESRDEDVEIETVMTGRKVLLQGGGRGVARLNDTVDINQAFMAWLQGLASAAMYAVPFPGPTIALISSASTKTEADQ